MIDDRHCALFLLSIFFSSSLARFFRHLSFPPGLSHAVASHPSEIPLLGAPFSDP